jgi:hypothetical protein
MPYPTASLIKLLLIVLISVFIMLASFRKGDRRQGQLFAYLSAGWTLWVLDHLFPGTWPWLFYGGCLVLVAGFLIYFTHIRSLFDWRHDGGSDAG